MDHKSYIGSLRSLSQTYDTHRERTRTYNVRKTRAGGTHTPSHRSGRQVIGFLRHDKRLPWQNLRGDSATHTTLPHCSVQTAS